MTELFWRLSPPHSTPPFQFLLLILTSWCRRPSIQLSSIRDGPCETRLSRTVPGMRGCTHAGPDDREPQQVCGDRDGLSTTGKSCSCSYSLAAAAAAFSGADLRARWWEPQSCCAWFCCFCSTHYCNKWGAAFQAEIKERFFAAGLDSTIGYPDEWALLSAGITRCKSSSIG